jgi:hypothetical protein
LSEKPIEIDFQQLIKKKSEGICLILIIVNLLDFQFIGTLIKDKNTIGN